MCMCSIGIYVYDCRMLNQRGMTNDEILSMIADSEEEEEEEDMEEEDGGIDVLDDEVERVLLGGNMLAIFRKM